MMYQCSFTSLDRWVTLMRDIYNEGSHACRGQGILEKPLFIPLNVTVKLKLLLLLLSRSSRVRLCVTPETAATRLPCSWYSPGKNTGVGCHFLLQCMKVKSQSEVAQSCLTLSHLMDCSPPGSSVMGFSRQEHWSGLPFHPPMHESEKSK